MPHVTANYRRVLKEAQQLPPHARRLLAEALLRPANSDEQTILITMKRLQPDRQTQLHDLMDRNNEGQLNFSEREELTVLVARYQSMLLFNTEALLKLNCPELFTHAGRLSRRRLTRSLRSRSESSQK